MKIIDCGESAHKARKSGSLGGAIGQGFRLRRKQDAQEILTNLLAKALDNRFLLLNNIDVPGLGKPAPLFLIGPTGIWVISPNSLKGVFRANESTWEQLNEKSRVFEPAKPNLFTLIGNWAKTFTDYLASLGIVSPPIEPVLFFSDPGAHIDSNRPSARIVLADGLPHFLAGLFQAKPVLENEDIRQIVIAIAGEEALEPTRAGLEIKDDFSLHEKKAPEKPVQKPPEQPSRLAAFGSEEPQIVRNVSKFIPFTSRQWILLGILLLVTIIILIALVFVVLINA